MLRPIRHDHARPRLLADRITYSGGTPSVAGVPASYTLTDNGSGDTTLTFTDPFQRQPIAILTPSETSVGSIGNLTSASKTAVRIVANTSGGAGQDETQHFLVLGWDSPDILTHTASSWVLKHERPRSRILPLKVVSNVASTSVRHFTVTNTATGTYTVAFSNPFNQAPVLVGTVIGTTAGVVNISATSVNTSTIKTYDAAGSLADFDFYLFAVGCDAGTITGGLRREINTVHRLGRLLAFEITVTGGVPALTIGGESATIADTAPGVYTISYGTALKRAAEIVAIADGTSIVTISASTTTGCVVRTFSNAGAAADAGLVHIFALGYDDTAEY